MKRVYTFVFLTINITFLISAGTHSSKELYLNNQLIETTKKEKTEKLIMQGANVNTINDNGQTPVHYASLNNDIEILNFFIDNGADIHAKNNKDQSPLYKEVFAQAKYT